MLDYLATLDYFDWAIVGALLVGALLFAYKKTLGRATDRYTPNIVPMSMSNGAVADDDDSFVKKMQHGGRSVAIFYGSQTGTAEELAGRLAKDAVRYGLKAIVLDPEESEMEDLAKLGEIENSLAIFCIATYGEGDPTDNAQQFFEFLEQGSCDLSGLRYAVFGLGNKTYEHYNSMGKVTDNKLEEMSAQRVYELGLGDDDGNLEEDFMRWRENFWPTVCEKFGLTASGDDVNLRQYRLEIVEEPSTVNVFRGEHGRLGSLEKQRPPFDLKNPFLSSVVVNSELHQGKERSCRHIELDISDSRLRYEAGDHAAIFPTNEQSLVNELGQILDVDLDVVFKLINVDEDSSKKHPFPCPCSYRTALSHYVDIVSPLRSHVIKELANYTSDPQQKEYLQKISSATEDGLHEYHRYIQSERRSVLDILRELPSCRPQLDHLLELLPRLQARYYSIASSPKKDASRVAVTAVVLDYHIGERHIKGVATNYLKHKMPVAELAPKVPMFIRKSTLRLPHKPTTPVIMIGPGTGFAPFRGFIQDRDQQRLQGKEVGPMILFFGCRRRDEDYIYEDELNEWHKSGTLTELHVAFSREQASKVYVQHKLWDNRENMWRLINEQGAHIYICGDARNMAPDVRDAFLRIATEVGGKTADEAAALHKEMEKQKRYQADVWS